MTYIRSQKNYRAEILSYYYFLKTYNYDPCFVNQKSTDKEESTDENESVDLYDMPPPEGDEEVKEGKGLEILTLLINLIIN